MARRRYRGRSRTTVRRRRGSRRRGVIRRRIPRSLCPPSMLIRARVVTSGTAASASTTPTVVANLRGNDITDPLGSTGANQPLGYDQWKNFYRRAKVLGVKVTFTAHNSGSEAIVYGIQVVPENNTIGLTPWEYMVETPRCKYRLLSPDVDHGTLSMTGSSKKEFKIKDIKDAEEIACDIATDTAPSRLYYFAPFVANHHGTTAINVDWVLKVDYIVLLDKVAYPARSTA